jgi:hypothetical protein
MVWEVWEVPKKSRICPCFIQAYHGGDFSRLPRPLRAAISPTPLEAASKLTCVFNVHGIKVSKIKIEARFGILNCPWL